jgi:hypothetical protein
MVFSHFYVCCWFQPEQSEAKFESPPAKKPSKQAARPEPKYSANEQVVSFDGALRGTQRHYYAKVSGPNFETDVLYCVDKRGSL